MLMIRDIYINSNLNPLTNLGIRRKKKEKKIENLQLFNPSYFHIERQKDSMVG